MGEREREGGGGGRRRRREKKEGRRMDRSGSLILERWGMDERRPKARSRDDRKQIDTQGEGDLDEVE